MGKQLITENDRGPYDRWLGEAVAIRTVTMHYTGRLAEVHDDALVLEDAAWIADTGRFADYLADGTPSEVEPFPPGPVVVGRGAVIDCCGWDHDLPRSQK